ncbi:MAG TPA: biopolymer transporter ExbD [Hellea balneolensis]|uniref:Biopolymer transporter ExbD n=1 Tax=Hellea balneolensis TaxID=287478 RepID=A0A7C3GKM6_9PROT|nr:biopolymer transporter ExbD [Hellea balneolensis]
MRRRVRRGGDEAEVDMTPMLDIVFIMLIFFIVTATFLSERGIDLTQPPPPPDNLPPSKSKPAISVYVDDRNQCSVDGRGTECDRVVLSVERILADKPGANIILKVSEAASHGNLVYLKDSFDARGLESKIEIIPAGV